MGLFAWHKIKVKTHCAEGQILKGTFIPYIKPWGSGCGHG